MGFKISTALQTALLTTSNLRDSLNGSVFKIYGSTVSQTAADALVPSTADIAVAGTLLCIISVSSVGTGVAFDATSINGAIQKDSTETWSGNNVASGYASYYRLELSADIGATSTADIRAQGSVGQIGTDLIIASSYLTLGQEQRIDSYVIGLPTA